MNKNKSRELYDICLIWGGETEKAIKVTEDNKRYVWLPKSQVEYKKNTDGTVDVTIPSWLYEKSEFIS